MQYRLIFLFALFIIRNSILAQEVQWASRLLSYSSQYGEEHYSAKQVLGVPNALMDNAPQRWAWVPEKESKSSGEYIKVGFDRPMRIQQVAAAESLNPGSIKRIYLFDKNGRKYKAYENKEPKKVIIPSRIFRHKFSLTSFEVAAVKIELETKAVAGSNHIDAIAISSRRGDIKLYVDELQSAKNMHGPENLGAQVNSSAAERLPIIAPDGKTLFFTRKYHKENIGLENKDDIWVSYLQQNNAWSRAVNAGAPLNDREHNFVVASNPEGDMLYLANDYQTHDEGISYARKKGRNWDKPKTFKVRNHYNKSEFVSYHLSVDGTVLLMSVNRDDTYGFRDLYVSFRESRDVWTEPKNLGPAINTVGEESSVFLAADGKTIYFSSNGHQGFGGLDMFMSKRVDESWTRWTKPQNLGQHINTPGDDYSFSIAAKGDYAYFTSDFHTYGKSDIFRIKLPAEMQPEPVKIISGRIIKRDRETASAPQTRENLPEEDWIDWDGGSYTAVVPADESANIQPELEGYYTVTEVEDDPREEIDFDENILEDEEALADTDVEKNPVIQSLLDKLNNLKEEITTIGQKREKEKKEATPDPELEALKNKYRYLQPSSPQDAEAIRERKRQQLMAEREKQTQPQRESTPEKPETQPVSKDDVAVEVSGDEELDDMRRKFLLLNDPDAVPTKSDKKEESSAQKPAETLADEKPKQKETEVEEDAVATTESKPNPFHTPEKETTTPTASKPATEPTLPQPQVDIDQLEQEVRQELKEDLRDDIMRELEEDLVHSVRDDLTREMQDDIRRNLRDSLEGQVSQNIRNEVGDDVRDELRNEMEDDVREELVAAEKARLENEMRDELVEEIREELKRELSGPVKRDLKKDMEYVLKKEIEAQLRKELTDKIRKELKDQMANEPRDTVYQPHYQELEKDIFLMPVEVGAIIPLNNIFFDANKAVLKEESYEELERALLFLDKNNKVIVEVGGHTNALCSDVFASELSHERAKVVAEYFMENGVPKHRIQWKGYGKTHPIALGNSLAAHRKNQRVELKILKIEE